MTLDRSFFYSYRSRVISVHSWYLTSLVNLAFYSLNPFPCSKSTLQHCHSSLSHQRDGLVCESISLMEWIMPVRFWLQSFLQRSARVVEIVYFWRFFFYISWTLYCSSNSDWRSMWVFIFQYGFRTERLLAMLYIEPVEGFTCTLVSPLVSIN